LSGSRYLQRIQVLLPLIWCEALGEPSRGVATNYCERINVVNDDGPGGYDRTRTNRDAGKYDRSVADPDVLSDRDNVRREQPSVSDPGRVEHRFAHLVRGVIDPPNDSHIGRDDCLVPDRTAYFYRAVATDSHAFVDDQAMQ
jgi:hypothetical protein